MEEFIMKKQLTHMSLTKKKIGAAIICSAFMLMAGGASHAFAEDVKQTDIKENSVAISVANEADNVSIKEENGVLTYSTDSGKTWSKEAPDGTVIEINVEDSVATD